MGESPLLTTPYQLDCTYICDDGSDGRGMGCGYDGHMKVLCSDGVRVAAVHCCGYR